MDGSTDLVRLTSIAGSIYSMKRYKMHGNDCGVLFRGFGR